MGKSKADKLFFFFFWNKASYQLKRYFPTREIKILVEHVYKLVYKGGNSHFNQLFVFILNGIMVWQITNILCSLSIMSDYKILMCNNYTK